MADIQTGNIVDDIVADHREFESVFTELESGGDPRTQPELVEHVIAGIVRHAVAEEQYVYPAARELLPDGDEIVGHELKEHSKAEEVMKAIEQAGADDPRYDELVRQLIGDIRHHIEEEESDLLPNLRDACRPEQLRELSEQFHRAKKIAPTRPHPLAPDHPPANRILGPGAGLVDRLRDALSGRNS
ncbi:hemerythrin [Mycobacterium kubicae]|uniref:Hemerythrin n=1 Tax=Mycobacterium kubicae TaxID=120959 RepID=A0AAX1J3I5_9MYCO|nr:hemerythrin domain-containing protein [Mycobacterium kubicae]MCV7093984.1 hemerythrin domain-containing protein [Mycobacterium kubicae]OBF16864.1 hemerythrin [Mycobacterium kubicae]ORV95402.1 hemerythrin [Mycobacterium kubicae]QPI35961.1 hemerythrin domain-containing protein [Mycobacterium kubicae]GFG68208.1 hemerythrin [Mycobacterium kubicae]